MIYLPHIPEGFEYEPGVDPSAYPVVLEALYLSMVTLATLGFGDVVPSQPVVRLVAPLQGLTGFALLTAALTWFSQVYPPLTRRRTLALELKGLAEVGYASASTHVEASTLCRVLDGLTASIHAVRIDFTQHSEGYYFRERDADFALPRQLSYLLQLRDAARSRPEPEVRLSVERLSMAVEELTANFAENFSLTGADPSEVLTAYAAEHGETPRT